MRTASSGYLCAVIWFACALLCLQIPPNLAVTDANYTLTVSTPSGADIIPDACLNAGGTCDVGLSAFPNVTGRTYEMFAGVVPTTYNLQTESCGGSAVISVCYGGGASKCTDPTNPVCAMGLAV